MPTARTGARIELCLTRRRVQRASTTPSFLLCLMFRLEVGRWAQSHGRPRRINRRRGNEATGLTVRCLGIARHHAVGRSESKGSLKSRSGSNDIRRRSLCQGRIECPDRGYSYNDRKGSHDTLAQRADTLSIAQVRSKHCHAWADPRRGAADRGQHRQAAGPVTAARLIAPIRPHHLRIFVAALALPHGSTGRRYLQIVLRATSGLLGSHHGKDLSKRSQDEPTTRLPRPSAVRLEES